MKTRNFLMIMVFLLNSCGPSPLLHHRDAQDKITTPNSQNEEKATCSLSLDQGQTCGRVIWLQGPSDSGESHFEIELSSVVTGQPVNYPNLKIALWMLSMGHGSAPVQIQNVKAGVYRVEKVYFLMAGEWEVRIFDAEKPLGAFRVTL